MCNQQRKNKYIAVFKQKKSSYYDRKSLFQIKLLEKKTALVQQQKNNTKYKDLCIIH